MNLSNGKNFNMLLLLLLVAALLFAVYYYLVLPKKNELENLEYSVKNLETEVTNLQEQSKTSENEDISSLTMLDIRKKLPQTREIDKLLLNLEEIEYITGTRIVSIDFNIYDELVSESSIVEKPVDSKEFTEGDFLGEVATGAKKVKPTSSIASESLPPELKLITFSVKVESPDHSKLQSFIKEIEKLERIMHIDSIEYSLPGEENEFAAEPVKTVTATIQVTTFYYEGEQ